MLVYCRVVQCALQCVAVCCRVLQPYARQETQREEPVALGSLLQQNATGSLLQQSAIDCKRLQQTAFPGARKCSVMQSVAVYCILLHSVVVCCSVVLQ